MSELPPQLDDASSANQRTTKRWQHRVKILAVGVLVLSLPTWWLCGAVSQALKASHRSSCKCYLKQFGTAMHSYHDQYGSLPPAFVLGPDDRKWHSWRVLVLPFLGQQELYEEYRFDEPWDGPNNRKLLAKMPLIYACPSRPREAQSATVLAIGILACSDGPGPSVANGYTSYAAVFGPDCAFRGTEVVTIKEITDGISNTLLIGECTRTKIPWTKPDDIDIELLPALGDADGFSGSHEGGVHFLIADGAVRFVKLTTAQETVNALFTRNGGETTDDF